MASIQKQQAITANMILLKVHGLTIGLAQNFRPTIGYGTQGVYQIGTIMPEEHVHLRYEGAFTMSQFAMKDKDLAQLDLIGLGEDILDKDIIDIQAYDQTHEKTLWMYRGCTFSQYNVNIQANSIVVTDVSGYYLSADMGQESSAQ